MTRDRESDMTDFCNTYYPEEWMQHLKELWDNCPITQAGGHVSYDWEAVAIDFLYKLKFNRDE